jgi:hypothetical protein
MSKWNPNFDLDLTEGQFTEGRFASILRLFGDYIEIKDESQSCPKYGNLFLELWQPNGIGGLKKSGLSVTKSNWWVEQVAPFTFVVFNTDKLKEFVAEEFRQRKARGEKVCVLGGDRKQFKGILLNLEKLMAWMRKNG